MQKVFVMYKLKPGVTMEQYKKFSAETDRPITPHQPGVISFKVYEIKGRDKGGSPFDIVEDVDVESWDAWNKCVASEGMKKVVEEWGKVGDESSMTMIYGDEITD